MNTKAIKYIILTVHAGFSSCIMADATVNNVIVTSIQLLKNSTNLEVAALVGHSGGAILEPGCNRDVSILPYIANIGDPNLNELYQAVTFAKLNNKPLTSFTVNSKCQIIGLKY